MRQAGVTLLELLVTLTIVMVLASVALPLTRMSAKRSHEIELRQHLRIMRAALDTFEACLLIRLPERRSGSSAVIRMRRMRRVGVERTSTMS